MSLKKKLYTILLAGFAFCTTACSDYLDISNEMSENLTLDKVFDNPNYTRNWYGNIYLCISEYSAVGTENGFMNPWSNLCGECSSQASKSRTVMTEGYTASTAIHHRWDRLYQSIRQAMIFIRDAHDEGVGSDSNRLTAADIARMKDDARFLIAYCYFCLFEQYGPVPIVEKIDDAAYPEVTDYKRPTVSAMVEYIDGILADILERDNLPESVITNHNGNNYTYNLNEVVRPTKIAARALRAKLWVYAASKLFNGGWEAAMKLQTVDGEQIFAPYDRSRWEKAKVCLEDLLQACRKAGHDLYKVEVNGVVQSHQSIYELFQIYNQEILWCTTTNEYSSEWGMERRTNPRDVNSSWGTIGPSQEAVDMFFTDKGLTIEEDPNYQENSLVAVFNPTYNVYTGKEDKNIFSMYANREPRFYADVMYQGKSWFNQNFNNAHPDYFLDFSLYGGAGPQSSDTPMTGYMLAKFKNRMVNHVSGDIKTFNRVSILYRLADFYLYYAEVLNELDPSDPRIIEYLDYVRTRAGIPTYAQLEEQGLKTIRGDYDKQFDAIQRERFVELFCEGQRYFDVHRWMVCGKGQIADQTRFSGMNEYGTTDIPIGQMGSYYNRTKLENRIWEERMYLYPIHHNVVTLSQGLIPQNPGW